MMDQNEYFITCAMEECGEINQALSKVIRFGKDNHHPDYPDETNSDNVLKEFYQLETIISLLQEADILPVYTGDEIKKIQLEKIHAVEHYYRQYTQPQTDIKENDAA